ncbi:MAG: ComF family protein [Desulfobacterales bacterium]|nr:ComF family protein [Desulfobacterales bacterium]
MEEGQRGFCSNCLSEIHWIESPYCSVCGIPFISKEVESHPCGACVTHRKYFTMARALGTYEGSLQEAIHHWKYEGKTNLTPFFAEWLAEGLKRYWEPDSLDLLIPVPLHTQRLRERGFNQALVLVKELSRRTGIPYQKTTLQKKKPTVPQVNLSGAERGKGLRGAFHVIGKEELVGKSALLVDDVYTTGATVNECSRVLRRGGAKRVDVLTLAHAIRTS